MPTINEIQVWLGIDPVSSTSSDSSTSSRRRRPSDVGTTALCTDSISHIRTRIEDEEERSSAVQYIDVTESSPWIDYARRIDALDDWMDPWIETRATSLYGTPSDYRAGVYKIIDELSAKEKVCSMSTKKTIARHMLIKVAKSIARHPLKVKHSRRNYYAIVPYGDRDITVSCNYNTKKITLSCKENNSTYNYNDKELITLVKYSCVMQ